ncbi:TfoX/Sxy family protein [Sandaracinus amylolyticus]|uniref:TfoX/Sxy family protein n=1 Tax=Sandaracinus amylolyticus TaxID=927083 RepID=UPI001F1E81F3|nr:TfoX/Sxy family protein [Sandaracinus amylolyticus]UJR86756.1 Hypothetical protein I5071_88570 [Sandaracinus amylolyticus]
MAVTLEDLKATLEDATRDLADVSVRKAFGSFGLFVGDSIFALAWKRELRIGVKLPDEVSFASLMGTEGASAWAPHKSPMRGWVLVPEPWHDDMTKLRPWVRRAYEQVLRMHAEDEVPSMGERAPAKVRATKTKKKDESAIATLHDGATRAHRVEKPGTKTAAAPVRAKKSAKKKG